MIRQMHMMLSQCNRLVLQAHTSTKKQRFRDFPESLFFIPPVSGFVLLFLVHGFVVRFLVYGFVVLFWGSGFVL